MIEPFISPTELKKLIDAGQNWVPIKKAEWPSFVGTYKKIEMGYSRTQRVGWVHLEEESPLDLDIPVGVVLAPCVFKSTNYDYDVVYPITTWYGLIEGECRDPGKIKPKEKEEKSFACSQGQPNWGQGGIGNFVNTPMPLTKSVAYAKD